MKKLLNTLYLTNPEARLRKKNDALSVVLDGREVMNVPFHLIEAVVLFGHVGCSMSVLSSCAERGVGVVLLDERGRFAARVEGPISGNVLLRKEQYRRSSDAGLCLMAAKRFVIAKFHNARAVMQRYSRDYPDAREHLNALIDALAEGRGRALSCRSLDELRGVEGELAHLYFSCVPIVLRSEEPFFPGRVKRPPTDPINAALSFLYTMLGRELATGCEAVGLDPQMGYLHACRPGRASLALDLIEELRAPLVDRFVFSLFNRGQLGLNDFRKEGEACLFSEAALKKVLGLWQERKREQVTHPFLGGKMPFGLIPFVQAQLFARFLRGDLDDYPAILWR